MVAAIINQPMIESTACNDSSGTQSVVLDSKGDHPAGRTAHEHNGSHGGRLVRRTVVDLPPGEPPNGQSRAASPGGSPAGFLTPRKRELQPLWGEPCVIR